MLSLSFYNIFSNEIRKDVIDTQGQQKLLRGMLKSEFERMRAEMANDFKLQTEKNKPESNSEKSKK